MYTNLDINCDTGEGTGNEKALMPYLTSANIACGIHAGDVESMKKTVALCLQHGVAIGAHPSYPDKENFGRTDMIEKGLRPEDIYSLVLEQLQVLDGVCKEMGAVLHHVKPHGALYNRAAWDETVADFICKAMADFQPGLLLYGLSGSKMADTAFTYGLPFVHEVFADRTYQDDGSLTPRSQPNALIKDETACLAQVKRLVKGSVTTVSGKSIPIKAETICVHGDGPHALSFAKAIHSFLMKP